MSEWLDQKQYGRLLCALRIVRGYERNASGVADLVRKTGLDMSDRVYYSLERGEKMPGVDEHFAICEVLHPEPGYFESAIRHTASMTTEEDGDDEEAGE